MLKIVNNSKGLRVVLELAVLLHPLGQRQLAGVSERRVSQVVGQSDHFGQQRIASQRRGQ